MLNFLLFTATIGMGLAIWVAIVPAVASARLQERLAGLRIAVVDAQLDDQLSESVEVDEFLDVLDAMIARPRDFSFSRVAIAQRVLSDGQPSQAHRGAELDHGSVLLMRNFEGEAVRELSRYMIHSSALWPILVPGALFFRLARKARKGRRGPHAPDGARPGELAKKIIRSGSPARGLVGTHA